MQTLDKFFFAATLLWSDNPAKIRAISIDNLDKNAPNPKSEAKKQGNHLCSQLTTNICITSDSVLKS